MSRIHQYSLSIVLLQILIHKEMQRFFLQLVQIPKLFAIIFGIQIQFLSHFFSIFSPTFFNFFNFFLHCLSLFPNFFIFFFQVLFSFFPVFFSTLILCQVMLSNHRFSNKEKENFVVLLVVDSKDIEKSRKIVECCKVQTNYYTSFLLL